MEERKGLFTPEQEEFLAVVLDDLFKSKKPLYEKFDKTVFKTLLKVADDSGADKINPEWKTKIVPIVDAAMIKDVEAVRTNLVDLLNEKIDVPKLDEEQELMVFDAFTRFLAAAVDFYMQKQNK